MEFLFKRHRFVLTLVTLLGLTISAGISGCSDNPVSDTDHDHDHEEATGLVIYDGDQEIVRVVNSGVTGALTATVSQRSAQYTLKFIAEDGDEFVPDDPDFSPSEVIDNTSVLEIERDNDSDWNFYLVGKEAGVANIQLTIKHGGHNDFISAPITVTVQP